MKTRNIHTNIYTALLYRISLAMLVLSLSRIAFFLYNRSWFHEIPLRQFMVIMAGGLRFDLTAVLYINLPFILLSIVPFDFRYGRAYQAVLKYLFFITNGISLTINSMDFVYYRFALTRATSEVFSSFSNESGLGKLGFKLFTDYWPAALIWVALLVLIVFLYGKVRARKPDTSRRLAYFIFNFLMIFVVLTLMVGGMRGGYKHSTRPITISNAAVYAGNVENVAIVLNTPFSIMKTYGKAVIDKKEYFDDNELKTLYNPHKTADQSAPFIPKNVVVIILESFGREYIGAYNRDLDGGTYKGYSPFLDSLISVSLTWEVSLANGRKSIDAMPSILASVPSLETPYILSHYANNRINGLAHLLKKKGYYTAFFHGAANGSMGFDSFATMAGFDDYFGMREYPDDKDYDGIWGIWDEPFLSFFADRLSQFREPFFASVFTVSSHHPFAVPEEYKGKFRKGPYPITEVVGYSDFALRKFFRQASEMEWFRNTLFVITADHTNDSMYEEYRNAYGYFSIPIIFYEPGGELQAMKPGISQQIDIMPTVLSWLNYDEEYIAFGNDLLDESGEPFAFNTLGKIYNLYMKDHLIQMVDGEVVSMYNFRTDKLLKNNLAGSDTLLQRELENKLKAIIQSYNSRMADNNMTVEKPEQTFSRKEP